MTDLNAQMVEVLSGIRSEIKVDAEGKGSITKYGLATEGRKKERERAREPKPPHPFGETL